MCADTPAHTCTYCNIKYSTARLCCRPMQSDINIMAADYRTSEARAFREHYDKLMDSIQEPDLPVLGARFFSRQIISKETMEMVGNTGTSRAVRASKLMLAVMAGLDIHPEKFESTLNVFREEHVDIYAQLSSMIKETYGKN